MPRQLLSVALLENSLVIENDVLHADLASDPNRRLVLLDLLDK